MADRPDLYWRAIVRRGCTQFHATTGDPDADFLRYVEDHYRDARQRAPLAPAVPPALHRPDLAIYLLATALLTYGRLDVIDDLLGNVPGDRHPARLLARSVSWLLPLASGLDPVQDPTAVATWIRQHRNQLTWRPDEGRFVLDASRG